MKHLIISISWIILLASCGKETPPYINLEPDRTVMDTSYIISSVPAAESRNVLIEEFSGVRCPNCPAAQVAAKGISEANPGRVNVMTVQPLLSALNSLTRPFDKNIGDELTSKYDMRSEAGARIIEMVGTPQSLPSGNINRKLFGAETTRNIDYQKWSAYVNQELSVATPVNMNLTARNTGDSVEVSIKLTYTSAVSDSQFVSIALLEGEIEDVQESKDANGKSILIENYIHNHLLRAYLTSYFGDYLSASYIPGRVFEKKYRIKRDPKWNAANLDVIAFVNLNTTKKDVIHSKSAKVN